METYPHIPQHVMETYPHIPQHVMETYPHIPQNVMETYRHITNNIMETYLSKTFTKTLIYDFRLYCGGIGDNIKYFAYALDICMKNNIRLYYKRNNIPIESYLKLKYESMYITTTPPNTIELKEFSLDSIEENQTYIITPYALYEFHNTIYESMITPTNQIFVFSEEVINRSKQIVDTPLIKDQYISIHLRLGDKYLETDKNYVNCPNDTREFNQKKIAEFIQKTQIENKNQIVFFCDNQAYKKSLKKKFDKLIIPNTNIGHTGLANTTYQQVLDGIAEYYLLTNSREIIAASTSGFSDTAAKYRNIPISKL